MAPPAPDGAPRGVFLEARPLDASPLHAAGSLDTRREEEMAPAWRHWRVRSTRVEEEMAPARRRAGYEARARDALQAQRVVVELRELQPRARARAEEAAARDGASLPLCAGCAVGGTHGARGRRASRAGARAVEGFQAGREEEFAQMGGWKSRRKPKSGAAHEEPALGPRPNNSLHATQTKAP